MSDNTQLTKDLKSEALKTVVDFRDEWLTQTEDLREKWKGIYEICWVFKKLNKIESENKSLVNKCFENIQAILPRIYGQRPKYQLFPRQKKDSEGVELSKALMDFQWDDYETDDMFYDAGNWFLTYGTHVIFVGTDIVQKMKTKNVKGKKVMEKFIARDTQGIKHIPVWDFMIDPKEKDLQKAPGVAYRENNVLVDDLRSTGLYDMEALNSLKLKMEGGESNPEQNEKYDVLEQKEGILGNKITNLPVIPEVVHFYGLLNVEEDEPPVEYIVTVAGDGASWEVIRMEENFYEDEDSNPYRPFVDFHNQKDPHMFYSKGEVEQIMGLQAVFNTFLRQRIESVRKSLRNKWIMVEDSVVEESALQTNDDNAIIVVKRTASAPPTPVVSNDITGALFNDLQFIEAEINKVSGVTDFSKGTSASTSQTATVAALNAEAGNQRFTMKLRNLQKSIKKYIRIRLYQNHQFLNKKQVVRIFNEGKLKELEVPAFPKADVDIIIEEGSTVLPNSVAEQQKSQILQNLALQLLQLGVQDFMQLPPIMQFSYKESLKALGYNDVEKILGIQEDDPKLAEQGMRRDKIQRESGTIDDENRRMASGEGATPNMNDDHEFHLQAHADFLVGPEGSELSNEIKTIFIKHMLIHKKYAKQSRGRPKSSLQGIARSEGGATEGGQEVTSEQGLSMVGQQS